MPYLKIQSNQAIDQKTHNLLLQQASALVADQLKKPERYVMVALEGSVPMSFAGNTDPTVYMELKSIGLPTDKTATLSRALTDLVAQLLAVKDERVYIEFADAAARLWGWNGDTF